MNNFFHFKQFTIYQDRCAMKVTEVACIQAAWTCIPAEARRVLDIGCGTGLLSLMIAQKYPAIVIDAVEIDEESFLQAKENCEQSPFHQQIKCIRADIKHFLPDFRYDFIICNPPFFEKQLLSDSRKKNIAWHSTALSGPNLVSCMAKLLHQEGSFSILLPANRIADLIEICARHHFRPEKFLQIKHSETHSVNHTVIIFSRKPHNILTETLIIRKEQHYSDDFKRIMSGYYAKL